jgi:hypothetical protein
MKQATADWRLEFLFRGSGNSVTFVSSFRKTQVRYQVTHCPRAILSDHGTRQPPELSFFGSTSKYRENQRIKLDDEVRAAATAELAALRGNVEFNTEEEIFKASDAVIDLMKVSWADDETLLSRRMCHIT